MEGCGLNSSGKTYEDSYNDCYGNINSCKTNCSELVSVVFEYSNRVNTHKQARYMEW